MAPTPPSSTSPSSVPGLAARHEERIRRNVACISCRDSKVRCRAGVVAGQPCQRCAKLQLSCVYDKSHKRVTKRSKLEILEQELKTIKEAVHPRSNGEASWSPPTPGANNPILSQQIPSAQTLPPIQSIVLPEFPKPPPVPVEFKKTGPTKSRLLGGRLLSGEDIDYYFSQFLQCFHPYVPILRKKDPDECYEANATLFWVIIYVTSRRYARDDYVFGTLVEQLTRDIWTLVATPNLDMEAIHAILFVCTWPFPTIRFVTDPSTTLITVALNACMLLGLHTGQGSNPRFLVGGRLHMRSTDIEASMTWIACCVLAQRIATYSGIPAPFLIHNDVQSKKIVEDTLSPELMTLFELQMFSNKLHTAMAQQVAAHGGVFESTVKMWEDELEALKPFAMRSDTDYSRFFLLASQLEIQGYYFLNPPSHPPLSPLNTHRAYFTAKTLLTTALTLDRTTKFLSHGPNWAYRIVVDAGCIAISTLHSTAAPPGVTNEEANAIASQISTAAQACSVRDGDLPARGAIIMDTFWGVRHLLPKFEGTRRGWPERIGAAVKFWCLTQVKDALQEAKKSTEGTNKGVNKGLEAFHGPPQDQTMVGSQDPFQDVDWSIFLDDFGWAADGPVFLGPPQC